MAEVCPHGCTTVCPHCDPRGFMIAYAKVRNQVEALGHTDEEIEGMVDQVLAGQGAESG